MADGKIYITISDKRYGDEKDQKVDSSNKASDTSKDKASSLFKDYTSYQVVDFISSKAKESVMFTMRNIGNFKGTYTGQAQVNESLSICGAVANIGLATVKYGLPGFIVSSVSTALSYGYKEYGNYVENNKINYQIDRLRELSGLNQLNDGGRGTEN